MGVPLATLDGALAAAAGATLLLFPALYALALLALVTIAREWKPVAPLSIRWRGVGGEAGDDAPNAPANAAEPRESAEKAAIRAFARRHGMTSQRAVAERIGEPPSTLSEFANGKLPSEIRERIIGKLGE